MKTTNYAIAIIVTLALAGQACTKEYMRIEGVGSITTETLNISNFSGIRLEGSDAVHISYGPEQKVEVTGHPNIISRIKTDVNSGVWDMGLENGNYGNYELSYALTLPTLSSVEVIGSADVRMLEQVQTTTFELFLMGSGSFLGFDLNSRDAYIEIAGSGNCEISTSEQMDVIIEGSGSVYYKGSPAIQTEITGSGRVVDAN